MNPPKVMTIACLILLLLAEVAFCFRDSYSLIGIDAPTQPSNYAPLPDRNQWGEQQWCYFDGDGAIAWCQSDDEV